jgi:hypothetical protein
MNKKTSTTKPKYPTWEFIVCEALCYVPPGEFAKMESIYILAKLEAKVHARPIPTHFKAKVRQVCQKSERIEPKPGVNGYWRLIR